MPGDNYVSLLHVQLVLALFYVIVTALYLSFHRDYYNDDRFREDTVHQFHCVQVCDMIVAVSTVLSFL